MSEYEFTVSLRIRHPTLDPQTIAGTDDDRRFLVTDCARVGMAAQPKVLARPPPVFEADVAFADVTGHYLNFFCGAVPSRFAPSHGTDLAATLIVCPPGRYGREGTRWTGSQ